MDKSTYKAIHEFTKEDLQDLFLSVEWSSGHFPDKLQIAMRNYEDYLRIVVVGYDEEVGFYENYGFEKVDDASPLFITGLWT